jgi:hypothetical protein
MKRTVVQVFVFAVIFLVAGLLSVYNTPKKHTGGEVIGMVDGGVGIFGVRCEKTNDGNWTVYLTSAATPIDDAKITVSNTSTGNITMSKLISDLKPEKMDPDAVFIDCTGNNIVSSGDSVILKSSSSNIKQGYKVQFTNKDGSKFWSSVKELP